jgi:hypothetical protein
LHLILLSLYIWFVWIPYFRAVEHAESIHIWHHLVAGYHEVFFLLEWWNSEHEMDCMRPLFSFIIKEIKGKDHRMTALTSNIFIQHWRRYLK